MSTKKKTTKTKTTAIKRSTDWHTYFSSAITGLANAAAFGREHYEDEDMMETDITEKAAYAVKMAEKIADIAEARNS